MPNPSHPTRQPRVMPRLAEGDVPRTLLRLTFPMVWGILAVMMFNITDTFFVGQLGPLPLAAIGFTFPVVFVVTGTAMGMGIGMSSVVSRAIGASQYARVSRLTTDGLLLTLLVVLALVVTGLLTLEPLFRLLGADERTLPLIRTYMVPWYLGVGFLAIPMVGNSAIRATGDTKTPSVIMILSGGVNVVLDPLFIFGLGPFPRWELKGAAIATVISYLITFTAAFYVLRRRERMVTFVRPKPAQVVQSWREILHVGIPGVCTNLMVPLGAAILTRIMAGYGAHAVAAFGVGSRLESLAMTGSYALSTAMASFAGQNFGAGRVDRVKEGMQFSIRYCITLSLAIWLVLSWLAEPIARLFNEDPEIVAIVQRFIWIVPLSYAGYGLALQAAAAFNANGMPLHAVLIFTTRMFVLIVPLALLGSALAGIPGIFLGVLIGNAVAGGFACLLIFRYIRAQEEVPALSPLP